MEKERNLNVVKDKNDDLLQDAICAAILETRSSDKMTDVIANLRFLIEEDELYQGLDISGISDYELGEKIKKGFKKLRAEFPRHMNSLIGRGFFSMENSDDMRMFQITGFSNIDFMYICESYELCSDGDEITFSQQDDVVVGFRYLTRCIPLQYCEFVETAERLDACFDELIGTDVKNCKIDVDDEQTNIKKESFVAEAMQIMVAGLDTAIIRNVVKKSLKKGDEPEEKLNELKKETESIYGVLPWSTNDKVVKEIIKEEKLLYCLPW